VDAALSLRTFADLQDLARIGTAWGGATVEPSRSFSSLNRAEALPAHRPVSESRGGIHVQWFSRNYGWGDYVAEQDRFADLFVWLGAPHGMMMFCAGRPAKTVIYIALDPKLAAAHYPDFPPAHPPPRDADFLVGHDEDGAEFRWGGRRLMHESDAMAACLLAIMPAVSGPTPTEAVREICLEAPQDHGGKSVRGRNSSWSATIRARGVRAGAEIRRAGAARRRSLSGQPAEPPEDRGRNATERGFASVERSLRRKSYMRRILRPLERALGTFTGRSRLRPASCGGRGPPVSFG
jgi:hypothetical protein